MFNEKFEFWALITGELFLRKEKKVCTFRGLFKMLKILKGSIEKYVKL